MKEKLYTMWILSGPNEKFLITVICIVLYTAISGFLVTFLLEVYKRKKNSGLQEEDKIKWDTEFLTIKIIFFPLYFPLWLMEQIMNAGGKLADKVAPKQEDLSDHIIDDE